MKNQKLTHYTYLLAFALLSHSAFAQDLKQEKMEQLNILTGEWVGTSKIYENGVMVREGSAFEKIAYDLDSSILVIELNTEFLQLHTIIYYDGIDQTYYYNRFSKEGGAIYPAEFTEGQLIVRKDERTRFFFRRTEGGGFQEYGEQLIDGKWIKTFEDNFINTE